MFSTNTRSLVTRIPAIITPVRTTETRRTPNKHASSKSSEVVATQSAHLRHRLSRYPF
jgi:peroxiredoxin